MNKMVKKGFSMIELLFVMVILAALAAIAIPIMSSGTESAILTSMKSDTKNIMTLIQSKYINNQDFSNIIPAEGTIFQIPSDNNGFAANVSLLDNTKIPLSDGNVVTIAYNPVGSYANCNRIGEGFVVAIRNPKIPNKTVGIDTCAMNKIISIDSNETAE